MNNQHTCHIVVSCQELLNFLQFDNVVWHHQYAAHHTALLTWPNNGKGCTRRYSGQIPLPPPQIFQYQGVGKETELVGRILTSGRMSHPVFEPSLLSMTGIMEGQSKKCTKNNVSLSKQKLGPVGAIFLYAFKVTICMLKIRTLPTRHCLRCITQSYRRTYIGTEPF